MNIKNFENFFDKIDLALEGDAHLDELAKRGNDPFKILISTILSARTRDSSTKEATDLLFRKFDTPELLSKANIEDIEVLIRKSGFYKVKAARIKEVSKIILEIYNGQVPQDFNELVALPGVGAKTANCVLVYAYQIPAIPVDTHVHRIPNRLGWIQTKTPEKTEKALKQLIPKKHWIRINRLFVKFGQQICLPLHPKCDFCPITDYCKKDFSMEQELREKRKRNNI